MRRIYGIFGRSNKKGSNDEESNKQLTSKGKELKKSKSEKSK